MKKTISLLIAHCALCIVHCHSQEIEWQKTIGGNDDDWLYSIQQTTDRGYILGEFPHQTFQVIKRKTQLEELVILITGL